MNEVEMGLYLENEESKTQIDKAQTQCNNIMRETFLWGVLYIPLLTIFFSLYNWQKNRS